MRKHDRIHKKNVILGLCMAMFLGLWECMVAYAGGQKSSAQEEVEECVRDYYAALSEGDVQRANEYFDGVDSEWREQLNRAMKEYGMEKYDEVQVNGYPVGDGETEWLLVSTYEIVAEGIETGMPGLEIMRARLMEGTWVLDWTMTIEGELEEVWEKEGILDQVCEYDQKYADAVAEDERIGQWTEQVLAAASAYIRGEETADKEGEEKAEQTVGKGEELPEKADDCYLVKQGDCLWKIAEKQLGDGMYWIKLYESNKSVIGENPDLILPGMRLMLP